MPSMCLPFFASERRLFSSVRLSSSTSSIYIHTFFSSRRPACQRQRALSPDSPRSAVNRGKRLFEGERSSEDAAIAHSLRMNAVTKHTSCCRCYIHGSTAVLFPLFAKVALPFASSQRDSLPPIFFLHWQLTHSTVLSAHCSLSKRCAQTIIINIIGFLCLIPCLAGGNYYPRQATNPSKNPQALVPYK